MILSSLFSHTMKPRSSNLHFTLKNLLTATGTKRDGVGLVPDYKKENSQLYKLIYQLFLNTVTNSCEMYLNLCIPTSFKSIFYILKHTLPYFWAKLNFPSDSVNLWTSLVISNKHSKKKTVIQKKKYPFTFAILRNMCI